MRCGAPCLPMERKEVSPLWKDRTKSTVIDAGRFFCQVSQERLSGHFEKVAIALRQKEKGGSEETLSCPRHFKKKRRQSMQSWCLPRDRKEARSLKAKE